MADPNNDRAALVFTEAVAKRHAEAHKDLAPAAADLVLGREPKAPFGLDLLQALLAAHADRGYLLGRVAQLRAQRKHARQGRRALGREKAERLTALKAERDAAQAEVAQLRARAAWIRTADRLPTAADHPAGPTRQDAWGKEIPVDHVPCLVVLRKYPQDVYFLQWNTHHGCWDDAHGDDFSAHASDALHWMPAPKAPAEVSRG